MVRVMQKPGIEVAPPGTSVEGAKPQVKGGPIPVSTWAGFSSPGNGFTPSFSAGIEGSTTLVDVMPNSPSAPVSNGPSWEDWQPGSIIDAAKDSQWKPVPVDGAIGTETLLPYVDGPEPPTKPPAKPPVDIEDNIANRGASDDFYKKVVEMIKNLDPLVLEFLEKNGITIEVVKVDDTQVNGASAAGTYHPDKKVVRIAETIKGADGKTSPARDILSTIGHEIGHAIDWLLGNKDKPIRDNPKIKGAFDKDIARLEKNQNTKLKDHIKYLSGNIREAVGEIIGMLITGQTGFATVKEYFIAFPELIKELNDYLKEQGIKTKFDVVERRIGNSRVLYLVDENGRTISSRKM